MPAYPPVFEQSTSTLYYSNDTRLRVVKEAHPDDVHADGTPLALPRYWYRVELRDGGSGIEHVETVFTTFDSVKADAFIAGYDLATS